MCFDYLKLPLDEFLHRIMEKESFFIRCDEWKQNQLSKRENTTLQTQARYKKEKKRKLIWWLKLIQHN